MREERKTRQYAWLFLPVAQELHAKNFVTRQAATRLARTPEKCAQKLRKCARSEMNRATLAKRPMPKCATIQEEEQRLSSTGNSEQNGQHTSESKKT